MDKNLIELALNFAKEFLLENQVGMIIFIPLECIRMLK